MSELKATPGPWHVVHNGAYREINLGDCECSPSIAQVCPSQFLENGDNEEANAHLIAAAPELYEALLLAKSWLEGWASADAELATIEEALAKARGE